ncbi:hypothetical protein [Leucobacter sp. M11]|uniref:hypothetical protein n=1 Tax=Leucobacter sp. M11 TaxID=2993565 RepID=UPI002D7F8B68|nr:hypothetical protein [Leucobacter sp. M11]MEB4616490.1 hypothetical protein [Leucobacter sp. M11]
MHRHRIMHRHRFFRLTTAATAAAALSLSLGVGLAPATALPQQPPSATEAPGSATAPEEHHPHLSFSAITMTPVPGGVTVTYRYDLQNGASAGTHGLIVNGRYSPVGAGTATAAGTQTTALTLPAGTHRISIYSSHGTPGEEAELAQHTQDVTVALDLIRKAPVPFLTGTPQVGQTLGITLGTWDPGVSHSYQWQRNGAAIPGATGPTRTLLPEDRAAQITVTVTGAKPGHQSVSKTSSGTRAVQLGTQTQAPTPTITGTTKAGSTLTAKPGAWGTGVTLSYRWWAGSTPIAGAKSATLTLTSAHTGKTIAVEVTGQKAGYASAVRTSAATAKIR